MGSVKRKEREHMCGIMGYLGHRPALPIVLDGLKRLEYRGYDSAGIALLDDAKIILRKRSGKVAELEEMWKTGGFRATLGMGHTRWATHGDPSPVNAHPHLDCTRQIAVIHNGIIENCVALRNALMEDGHRFISSTDTEVIVHLMEDGYKCVPNLEHAVRSALTKLVGAYAIVVMSEQEPDKLIAARKGSPLAIGLGKGEYIIASDASAIVEHTRDVMYLADEEIAVVTLDGVTVKTLDDILVPKEVDEVLCNLQEIEKGHYPHFMLKEIHEQAETVEDAMRGRLIELSGTSKLGGIESVLSKIDHARRLIFTACGTSWHAALTGKYMLEQYANRSVSVEYASEFRYTNPTLGKGDVVFCISQSGETADCLAAVREAKTKGALVLGICNVVGSTIPRESDAGIYIHAGPEIGVASTKAFTSQLTVLALLTLLLARRNGMDANVGRNIVREMKSLPDKIRTILSNTSQIDYIAREIQDRNNALYLGRGYNFPVALEGALKLKEISYIHAEGYPAAEMKHGPIALIDDSMPVVFIAPHDRSYDKILSNIQEVKARHGMIIAVVNDESEHVKRLVDFVVKVPPTLDLLTPILSVIPLQMLAYHIAVLRGCDVDQPRNLAKSVTVE
jgi:glutamine---fructose-6-phosphate transaminase (isomerizing)